MGDESDDVGEALFTFSEDAPTEPAIEGIKQMLRPLFSGGRCFQMVFPMFVEGMTTCQRHHTEVGTRFCALFRQLGTLAAQIERASNEFTAIEALVKKGKLTSESQRS